MQPEVLPEVQPEVVLEVQGEVILGVCIRGGPGIPKSQFQMGSNPKSQYQMGSNPKSLRAPLGGPLWNQYPKIPVSQFIQTQYPNIPNLQIYIPASVTNIHPFLVISQYPDLVYRGPFD